MSGTSAKKLVKWHEGWLGEKDANGDLVGDWAQYFDKEQFKCRSFNVERKFSNGGRTSLIQHSESAKHKNIMDGKKRKGDWPAEVWGRILMTFLFWLFY